MKARGMLWRRVLDTSQEDRCDRRISTPVPSGLRSHHAFTALWKLLFRSRAYRFGLVWLTSFVASYLNSTSRAEQLPFF